MINLINIISNNTHKYIDIYKIKDHYKIYDDYLLINNSDIIDIRYQEK